MVMVVAEEENATEPEVTALANKETEKEDAAAAATVVVPTLESLPVELRTDIFSRLDAKTLGRFRCVSKPFSSFVSTPELISAHRIRSRKNPLLLYLVQIHDEPYSNDLVSVDTATTSCSYTGIRLDHLPSSHVSTCLEFICLHDEVSDIISVCNPTNKSMFSLPSQPPYDTMSVGFGYVTSTDKFKVLRVARISGLTSAVLWSVRSSLLGRIRIGDALNKNLQLPSATGRLPQLAALCII